MNNQLPSQIKVQKRTLSTMLYTKETRSSINHSQNNLSSPWCSTRIEALSLQLYHQNNKLKDFCKLDCIISSICYHTLTYHFFPFLASFLSSYGSGGGGGTTKV